VVGGVGFLESGNACHQVTNTASNLIALSSGKAVLINGDTISVDGERIRLVDIDAPEFSGSRDFRN
jgi:endonuclease YncB( thermonuclease family)